MGNYYYWWCIIEVRRIAAFWVRMILAKTIPKYSKFTISTFILLLCILLAANLCKNQRVAQPLHY